MKKSIADLRDEWLNTKSKVEPDVYINWLEHELLKARHKALNMPRVGKRSRPPWFFIGLMLGYAIAMMLFWQSV